MNEHKDIEPHEIKKQYYEQTVPSLIESSIRTIGSWIKDVKSYDKEMGFNIYNKLIERNTARDEIFIRCEHEVDEAIKKAKELDAFEYWLKNSLKLWDKE